MKVAFLIPSTTRKRPWRKMEDTYLYNIFGQSFISTISDDIEYTIYINIDADDPIYSQTIEKNKFIALIGEKAKIKFITSKSLEEFVTQITHREQKRTKKRKTMPKSANGGLAAKGEGAAFSCHILGTKSRIS